MPLLLELEYKARQASATFKGISFDFRHRVGDGDARQARAAQEGFFINECRSFGKIPTPSLISYSAIIQCNSPTHHEVFRILLSVFQSFTCSLVFAYLFPDDSLYHLHHLQNNYYLHKHYLRFAYTSRGSKDCFSVIYLNLPANIATFLLKFVVPPLKCC